MVCLSVHGLLGPYDTDKGSVEMNSEQRIAELEQQLAEEREARVKVEAANAVLRNLVESVLPGALCKSCNPDHFDSNLADKEYHCCNWAAWCSAALAAVSSPASGANLLAALYFAHKQGIEMRAMFERHSIEFDRWPPDYRGKEASNNI